MDHDQVQFCSHFADHLRSRPAAHSALVRATPDVFGSGDPRGRPELRAALAEYLAGPGGGDPVRRTYRRRRDMLVSAVSRAAPDLRVRSIEAGLHAVLELPDHLLEGELLSRAERCSIGLHGLEPYRRGVYAGPQALLVSCGRPPDLAFSASLRALTSLLQGEAFH